MTIELRIDRLVLEGLEMDGLVLDIRAAAAIAAAIEAELRQFLTAAPPDPALGATPVLRAAPVELPAHLSPHLAGQRIARSVAGGLKPGGLNPGGLNREGTVQTRSAP